MSEIPSPGFCHLRNPALQPLFPTIHFLPPVPPLNAGYAAQALGNLLRCRSPTVLPGVIYFLILFYLTSPMTYMNIIF